VILNGIETVITRPDLMDRAIVLSLPRISEDRRRSEADFWNEFSAAHPRILGCLLDGLATALKNRAKTILPKLPRLADFARLMAAAEPAFKWEPGTFLHAFNRNRLDSVQVLLEYDPVADAIRQFMKHGKHLDDLEGWSGTVQELLHCLPPPPSN